MARIKQKVFAVFGLGIFGQTVAESLTEKGGDVIAADNDPALVESFKNKVTTVLHIDSTDQKELEKAPLDDVDVAIVTVGDNIEASIITTVLLKQRGVPYIISRAVSDIHEKILKQVGANEVINLQKSGGKALAQRLLAPEILETIPISSEYSFAELYRAGTLYRQKIKRHRAGRKIRLAFMHGKTHKSQHRRFGQPDQRRSDYIPRRKFCV